MKEQSRISRLSFADVIKRLLELKKDDRAFISSDPVTVERFVVVHGQIIRQLFAEFPDEKIRKSAFVLGLEKKMEERHHTKWLVKKKKMVQLKSGQNLNPRAAMAPVASQRKAMQATTTRLINRIWGEYYSNFSPEDSNNNETKEQEEAEEPDENEDEDAEEDLEALEREAKPLAVVKKTKSCSVEKEIIVWDGEPVRKMSSGEPLYKLAIVRGDEIVVGGSVLVEVEEPNELPAIYFVEYMFEALDGSKMFHGRMMQRGSQTVLGNAANEREVFLTNECLDIELEDVTQNVVVDIRYKPWGHEHRKDNANADKIDRARAEERKKKGLPVEYNCKSLYWPEKGAFFSLSPDTIGLGSGYCHSCRTKQVQKEKEVFKVNSSKTSLVYNGTEYSVHDFVYVSPCHFSEERTENGTFKAGRNVGLRAYVVCQIQEIIVKKETKKSEAKSTEVKVRRFYRPEDISAQKAYVSDIREVNMPTEIAPFLINETIASRKACSRLFRILMVIKLCLTKGSYDFNFQLYYSEETEVLVVNTLAGKCEVRKKSDVLPVCNAPSVFEHIFFCEHLYDPHKGSLKQVVFCFTFHMTHLHIFFTYI